MKNNLFLPIVSGALLILIFGLLIWQRFDMEPRLDVVVTALDGESDYQVGTEFSRGAFVDTAYTWLELKIGDEIKIDLGENTRLELEDLDETGPTIRIIRGRIFVESDGLPVWITTNTSENVVESGSASIVNYDFLESVHVIPIEGAVQTRLKTSGEYISTPSAIEIKEGHNPGYSPISADLNTSAAADFYEWAGSN
jgi:hypothetical protein